MLRVIGRIVLAAAIIAALAPKAGAQFQMPDPKQMSGIPRPVTDLPNASISVRLIRGSLSNNIAKHTVELRVGAKVLKAQTDDAGRAQFDGLTPGASAKASADVDGEHLESQEFPVPAQGGIRLLLVATDKSAGPATQPNAPAIAGQVVLGGRSRIVLEPGDENVGIYYLLEVVNTARVPVNTADAFTFAMPSGSAGCGMIDGSSPTASVTGARVDVQRPFAPGSTLVNVACELPVDSDALTITQRFPASLEQVAFIVKKVGDMKLSSPQIVNQQDMNAQGETYIAAAGRGVPSGQALSITLTGLPHHSTWPRWTALGLAAAVILVGFVVSRSGPADAAARVAERQKLVTRRERLLTDLARLDREHRGKPADDPRYTSRREDLVTALEHVYGALDVDDSGDLAPGSGRAA
jgi:hypothetical protein